MTIGENGGCIKDNFLVAYWVSQKRLPDLRCYVNKGASYLMKIMKGSYYTMYNLDLSSCFISASPHIDFP